MTFDKILVPVDFSTCSLMVAREAAELAVKLGARIVLLHVSDLPAGLPADAGPLGDVNVATPAGGGSLAVGGGGEGTT